MNTDSNKKSESDNWNINSSKLADKDLDWSFFEKGKKRPAEDVQNNTQAKPWTLNAHQPSQPKDNDGFAMPARPLSILKKPKQKSISEDNEEEYQFEVPDPMEANDNNEEKAIGPIDDEASGIIGKLLGSGTEVTLNVKPSDQHHYFIVDDKSKQTTTTNNQTTQKKKEQPKSKPPIDVKPEDDDDELDDVFKMKQYEIEQYGPTKTELQNDNVPEEQPAAPVVEKKKKDKKAFKF